MEARKRAATIVRRIIEQSGGYTTPRLVQLLTLAYRLGRLHGARRNQT